MGGGGVLAEELARLADTWILSKIASIWPFGWL